MWDFIKIFGKIEEDCINLCFVISCSPIVLFFFLLYNASFMFLLTNFSDESSIFRYQS